MEELSIPPSPSTPSLTDRIYSGLADAKQTGLDFLQKEAGKVQSFVNNNPYGVVLLGATAVNLYFTPKMALLGLAAGFVSGNRIKAMIASQTKETKAEKLIRELDTNKMILTKEKAALAVLGAFSSLLVASQSAHSWLAKATPLVGTVTAGYALYQYTSKNAWTQKVQW